MNELSSAAREKFWRDLVARFDHRIRGYCRRTRCDDDVIDQIVWDLWQEAEERESTLRVSKDAWPVLLDLLRPLCARYVRVARREVAFNSSVDTASDRSDSPDEQEPHRQLFADWVLQHLQELPEKQRIAVDFRYRWGMPYWAIAAGIGTAEATARVHVTRGIRALRISLSHTNPAPPRDTEEAAK